MLLGIRIATPLLKFCLPFVDLYILDGICTYIFKHELIVAIEKLLTVEQQ